MNERENVTTLSLSLQVLFKKLSAQKSGAAPERLSAEAGAHTFHVLNQAGVCFLTLAERSYPKKLAYQYLEELANEFNRLYGGNQVENVSRPYAFIKFGTYQALWCTSPVVCLPTCAAQVGGIARPLSSDQCNTRSTIAMTRT